METKAVTTTTDAPERLTLSGASQARRSEERQAHADTRRGSASPQGPGRMLGGRPLQRSPTRKSVTGRIVSLRRRRRGARPAPVPRWGTQTWACSSGRGGAQRQPAFPEGTPESALREDTLGACSAFYQKRAV